MKERPPGIGRIIQCIDISLYTPPVFLGSIKNQTSFRHRNLRFKNPKGIAHKLVLLGTLRNRLNLYEKFHQKIHHFPFKLDHQLDAIIKVYINRVYT